MAHVHEHMIPKPAIIAAGVLIAFTIALTAAGSAGLFVTPKARFADARATIAETASTHVLLEPQSDGSIAVLNPQSRALMRTIAANEGGFVHYTLTGLKYSRQSHGLDGPANVRVVRYADGRLMVHEVDTGVLVDVIGYGPTNVQSFQALLDGSAFPPVPRRG